MQPILTELLNLPGIEVENYTKVADRLILEVEAKTTKAKCPRCGEESNHLHQNRALPPKLCYPDQVHEENLAK
jgi:transposase